MLAGTGLGLAVSPLAPGAGGFPQAALVLLFGLILLFPRGHLGPVSSLLLVVAGFCAGLSGGADRLEAIDGHALSGVAGRSIALEGFVASAPRISRGVVRFPLDSEEGRVLVQAVDRGLPELTSIGPGAGVRVEGTLRRPPDWYRPTMLRQGLAMIVQAGRIELTGRRRGGPAGWVDHLRTRAETALERGMPDREASLAKGFVLGQDESIDPATVADFRDSGLAHLLAVSGQNVILLALLAAPFMALAGLRPGTRLASVALLIAIYVPLAGGGPSIQRAGVMGLAGLAAAAATRPASRAFTILLAVVVTLGLNPRATTDVGWQLSFAAVIGILLLSRPFRERIGPLVGSEGWRRALVDGLAITLAATLATAPLMAFHFERLPLGTVVANLAALPAVAPVMWLGMVSAALGQITPLAAIPFNLVNSVFLAYIAQVAIWFGRAEWSVLGTVSRGPIVPIAGYGLLGLMLTAIFRLWPVPRNAGDGPGPPPTRSVRLIRRSCLLVGVGLLACLIWLGPGLFGNGRRALEEPPPGGARVEILDIGQGDAILLRPDRADPVLVDGGPPGADLEGALNSAGVDRLAAVILTHGDLDHWGGLPEIFVTTRIDRFLFDVAPGALLAQARRAGAEISRLAAGERIRFGDLALEVIWPPPRSTRPGADPVTAPAEPNARSMVAILHWKRFRMLLTGDGESELVPVDPGPVDVLKVAHHGSEDAGLDRLLAQTDPDLAVISVGEANPFGHPTGTTLDSLDHARVPVLRTDRDGTVSVVLGDGGFRVETGR